MSDPSSSISSVCAKSEKLKKLVEENCELKQFCDELLELSSEEKSDKMVKIVVETFGEDTLRKLYCDLSHKEDWDEECSLCSMPTMLHKGPCTRKTEIGEAEHSDLWKSWSL